MSASSGSGRGTVTEGLRVALGIVWPAAVAVGLLAGFFAVGDKYADGFPLDLGRVAFPRQGVLTFVAVWSCFSALAAGALSLSLARIAVLMGRSAVWPRLADDRLLIIAAAIAGIGIPLSLRFLLLGNASFADDESSYRFMGQLLASGRLFAESHPMPDFFSRGFMVNDGRLYAQYFVGWPAILAVGYLFGVPWLMSPLCSGLTAIAAVRVASRVLGAGGARIVLLLYVSSPMLMLGAATDLSHTSCITGLAWMTWFFLRTREPDAPLRSFAGVAACFGIAFFIRPLAALGVGLPFLAFTLWPILRRPRPRELVAFAVPALVFAIAFLLVNQIQNGSPLTTAYQQIVEYSQANDFEFAGMPRDYLESGGDVPRVRDIPWHLAISANTLFRLNTALFGWPSSLLIALLALGATRARWFRASAVCFLATHFFQRHSGIDSFGPVYFMELVWPVLILTGVGYKVAVDALAGSTFPTARFLPAALTVALVLVSLAGYAPKRAGAMRLMAFQSNFPHRAVRELDDERVVIFAQRPFVAPCRGSGNFVLWRPDNDPDLENDVLWVNHIGVDRNKELMAYFPDRVGYVMLWLREGCKVELLRLADLAASDIPYGYTGPQELMPPICKNTWFCLESDLLRVRPICSDDPPEPDASLAGSESTTLVEFTWNPHHRRKTRWLDIQPAGEPSWPFAVQGRESYVVELDDGRFHTWRINTHMDHWLSEGWKHFTTPECPG